MQVDFCRENLAANLEFWNEERVVNSLRKLEKFASLWPIYKELLEMTGDAMCLDFFHKVLIFKSMRVLITP